MMFDFYWFREQLCLIACPYGRFQSALLDKFSQAVSYDKRRGEPRGKMARRVSLALAPEETPAAAGDCVDCGMCVTTCPTGIDIRDGLQMECINCAQCIDACDAVMTRVHKPKGLIRHASQAALDGETRGGTRFRMLFYPTLLAILAGAWILIFVGKSTADVTLLRDLGSPFSVLENGKVASQVRVKITNRAEGEAQYTLELVGLPQGALIAAENPVAVPANQSRTVAFVIEVPAGSFQMGLCDATLRIKDGNTFSRDVAIRLLGPFGQMGGGQ
jgi:cytochrome c oxidase accessory protein FixG